MIFFKHWKSEYVGQFQTFCTIIRNVWYSVNTSNPKLRFRNINYIQTLTKIQLHTLTFLSNISSHTKHHNVIITNFYTKEMCFCKTTFVIQTLDMVTNFFHCFKHFTSSRTNFLNNSVLQHIHWSVCNIVELTQLCIILLHYITTRQIRVRVYPYSARKPLTDKQINCSVFPMITIVAMTLKR